MAKSKPKTAIGKVYFAFLQEPRPAKMFQKKGPDGKPVGKPKPVKAKYEAMFFPDSKKQLEDMREAGMMIKTVDVGADTLLGPMNGKEYINARRGVENDDGVVRPPLPIFDSLGKQIKSLKQNGKPVKIGNGSKVKIEYFETSGFDTTGCFLIGVQIIDLVPYTEAPRMAAEKGSFVADEDIESDLDISDDLGSAELDDEHPWEVN